MYQVIARKYRPQTFRDLIGQEHVRTTLENAITSRRLAHGYIFSGQRGTGKTTVARILARCLNCIEGPTANPCGVCASCLEITAGGSPDVIEIDAASNRGINEMRELRENVRYRPSRDRYKVFIVDEAHQITNEAFNALLKTLEEPPEWAIFVLCTTEAHKIPNTIVSRCQQFSFRSVEFTELVHRMEYIVKEEGITAGEDVLAVIAQAGEGSVRDSLSALDQAIACCGDTLRVEDVRALLGMFGADSLRAVADAVLNQDGQRMLDIVSELERNGHSLQHFCRELARYWRNLLVSRIAGKTTRLIGASDREQAALLDTAKQFSEEDLTRYLHLTLELFKALQYSLQPRLHLELGLIKLVQAGRLQSIEEAIANVGAAPKSVAAQPAPKAAPLTAFARAEAPRPSSFQARVSAPIVETPEPVAAETTGDLRIDLRTALLEAGMKFSADAVEQSEVRLTGGELLITAPKALTLALKDAAVQRVVAKVVGKPVKLRVEAHANMSTSAAPETSAATSKADEEVRERALSHPGVKQFQELFPGAQIRNVRNLNE